MITIQQLKDDWKEGKKLLWNDPDPIEGNDYTISWIEDLSDIEEIDEFTPILIQYNNGGSEAQVFLHEIIYKNG